LFISKQAIEAHAGNLWLKSTPGDGACFVVELPLNAISTA
jgi:signal transduction histidine kinase